jgi:hypothetical protein
MKRKSNRKNDHMEDLIVMIAFQTLSIHTFHMENIYPLTTWQVFCNLPESARFGRVETRGQLIALESTRVKNAGE